MIRFITIALTVNILATSEPIWATSVESFTCGTALSADYESASIEPSDKLMKEHVGKTADMSNFEVQFASAKGNYPFPINPYKRKVELYNKQKTQGLSPYEEGEVRGLFVYSNNPRAAVLLQKEYLSTLGMASMSPAEEEELRLIRVEDYKREKERELHHAESVTVKHTLSSNRVTINEFSVIYEAALKLRAVGAWNKTPRKFLLDWLESVPDNVIIIPQKAIQGRFSADIYELENYFLSLAELPKTVTNATPKGALSVMESIRCLRDRIRTKKFLIGLSEAIDIIKMKGLSKIEVLDAGSGAIPILAIFAALLSKKVHVTAIELNPTSFLISKKLVEALGLDRQIQIINEDATKFKSAKEFDLIVSETMHSGLTAEPIVQIFSNVIKYLKVDGIVLPSKITIYSSLFPALNYIRSASYIQIYGQPHVYFEPQWKEVVSYRPGDDLQNISFSYASSDFNSDDLHLLFVTTEVRIGSQVLRPFESLITNPQLIRDSEGNETAFSFSDLGSQRYCRMLWI
ncbi:MAG: methyltransferase domain-containing protein [Bdellovibrionaceae bacterium]|nr:methyltransferase domain-containing protein [Pseudobdellovibrionaceae bacterium]